MQKEKARLFRFEAKADSAMAHLYMSGCIGFGDDIDDADFNAQWEEIKQNYTAVTIHINSIGGSVFGGLALYNKIRNSGITVYTIVEGICASIATVVALAAPKENRSAYKPTRFMIHSPSGIAVGSESDMRQTADMIAGLKKEMAEIYVEATGQSKEVVDGWLADGKDTWLTADEAKKYGFIGSVIKSEGVAAPAATMAMPEIVAYYNEAFNKGNNPKTAIGMKDLLAKLGVPENATEVQAVAAFEKVVAKLNAEKQAADVAREKAEKELHEIKAAAEKAKEDTAIALGKDAKVITAESEAHWRKLLSADFETSSSLLVAQIAAAKAKEPNAKNHLRLHETHSGTVENGKTTETEIEPKAISINQRVSEAQAKRN